MMLGKISGRVTTSGFSFEAEAKVQKLDFVAVKTPDGDWVTAYIDNITRYRDRTIAEARVIGYRNERGFLVRPNSPFAPETPVFSASEELIKNTLGLPEDGLYIGLLDGYNIHVKLPLKQLITKHVSILAKTGAGKSYMSGVLLEELAEKKIPVVVLDPHGEYSSLTVENDDEKELGFAKKFGIKPKSYTEKIQIFSPENGRLKLNSKLTPEEIFQCMPTKVTGAQKGLIYSAIRNIGTKDYELADVINEVSTLPSQAKWNLISGMEFMENTKVFSKVPTRMEDLVKEDSVSIVDLKFAKPEIQHMIAYKLMHELFSARKAGKIPGFFLVIEEAHTFCPERGFGEVASSKIIRTLASEGRKFGISLCVISQRPARVDKNVLSQCNTQVIMKVTNPNDLKAISDSAEGITSGLKEEIRDLAIGNALVIGVTEQPILVEIRVRRSKHGGEAITAAGDTVAVKVKNMSFPMKYESEAVKEDFKEAEQVMQVHYPVWQLGGTTNGDIVEVYVDGLIGEIIYEGDSGLRRTRGVKNLVNLSSTEKNIISYLAKSKQATLDSIVSATRMLNHDAKRYLKALMQKGLVTTDGYMYRPATIKIPHDLLKAGFRQRPMESVLEGRIVNFAVDRPAAEKVANLLGVSVETAQMVYYPYWLIVYKSRKALVDGITKSVDTDATKEIVGLIR